LDQETVSPLFFYQLCLAWFGSEAHVRFLRGHGCPANKDQAERKNLAERSSASLGRNERCDEEQDKADTNGEGISNVYLS
jgi:hypothetical protein